MSSAKDLADELMADLEAESDEDDLEHTLDAGPAQDQPSKRPLEDSDGIGMEEGMDGSRDGDRAGETPELRLQEKDLQTVLSEAADGRVEQVPLATDTQIGAVVYVLTYFFPFPLPDYDILMLMTLK